MVWLSDFGSNALIRFDPLQQKFELFSLPSPGANVRQLLGRPGEVWGAESGTDKLVVIRAQLMSFQLIVCMTYIFSLRSLY